MNTNTLSTALLPKSGEENMEEEQQRIKYLHERITSRQQLDSQHQGHAETSSPLIQPVSISNKMEYSTVPGSSPPQQRSKSFSSETPLPLLERKSTIDAAAGRIYANNAPKILLETITARTALLVIVLTYAVFFIGFALDFNTIYRSFNSDSYVLDSLSCSSYNASHFHPGNTWGCSSGNSSWNSTITQLSNVISIKLKVQQNNLTTIIENIDTDPPKQVTVIYDLMIWACYNEDGCGNHYESNNDYTTNPNVWQKVVTLNQENAFVNFQDYLDYSTSNGFSISYELLENTFQNQESIPTNGLVKAYHISVNYIEDPYGLFSGTNKDSLQYISYTFDVVTRTNQPIVDVMTIILIIVTCCLLAKYISVISKQPYTLPEQKWLVVYFALVIFFQNPIYVVIDWYKDSPPPGLAYASYVLNYLGQSGLFILWLLFADSINRKAKSVYMFYLPKIFFGLMIFVCGIVVLTIQFPGLNPSDAQKRNSVEAVINWTSDLRAQFIAFTFLYLLLILLWAMGWILRLFLTGRSLKRIPYMSTRYIQLSYRFFSIQATLVTFYYVFQYAAVLYYISRGTQDAVYDSISITDSINTLFRQQTQLFGKTFFLSIYAILLAFLFLPANYWETTSNKTLTASLAATYVITEMEHDAIVKKRKKALEKIKNNLLGQVTRFDQLIDAKVDVFCVDIASTMRAISYNAYYDPPDVKTISGFEGCNMDLESIGFELVDYVYERSHEVFGFVAREKATGRLVVSFRGTASKKQMEDNLNYGKKPVDFNDLSIPALDHIDGLRIKPLDPDEDFEMDSVSDDEDDLILDDDDDSFAGSIGPGKICRGMTGRIVKEQSVEHDNARETVMEKAGHATDNITKVLHDAVDVTNQGINKVVGATTGLVVSAAANTPGLKNIVKPHVHSGFWDAYLTVRGFVHGVLRHELVRNPTTVFFTGHSLGGALATYAALDVSLYTIPRVNAYLKHQAKLKMIWKRTDDAEKGIRFTESPNRGLLNWIPGLGKSHSHIGDAQSSPHKNATSDSHAAFFRAPSIFGGGGGGESTPTIKSDRVFVKKIKAVMYSFGSPRVGNTSFAQLYDRVVPSTFRVVVDGDLVVGLPPGYTHIGTEILIDSLASGSIIIDPSFVERWLRTHIKSSVAAHSLLVYRKSILGLKLAAEYMKQYVEERSFNDADPLKVAMRIRNNIEFTKLVEDHVNALGVLDSKPVDLTRQVSRSSDRTAMDGEKVVLQEIPDDKKLGDSVEQTVDTAAHSKHALSYALHCDDSIQSEAVLQDIHDMEVRHYEKDKQHMEELMKQIQSSKRPGAIGWIKEHTVGKLSSKKSSSKLANEADIHDDTEENN